MSKMPKPPLGESSGRCPVCSGSLILSRFGPSGPVYYCEQCAMPFLAQDLALPLSDSAHCPHCGSGSVSYIRTTLFGRSYKCRICGKTYSVPNTQPPEKTGFVAPIRMEIQGAKT